MPRSAFVAAFAAFLSTCAPKPDAAMVSESARVLEPPASPRALEEAPAPSPTLPVDDATERIAGAIDGWFAKNPGQRVVVQVDKPLYRLGETVWVKSWHLRSGNVGGVGTEARHVLVDPRGEVIQEKLVPVNGASASGEFVLPTGLKGGAYTIRAMGTDPQSVGERHIVVLACEPPRLKKKLEFVREAYGAGDTASAMVQVRRATGEPLANAFLTAIATIDGKELPRIPVETDADGGAVVTFAVPVELERGDGLLTVLAADGGTTESISRAIPILRI